LAKTTIDIEWTFNDNGGSQITEYEVWWNGGGSDPVTGKKLTVPGTQTNAQIVDLSPGTYYRFAIKAVNLVGSSSLSPDTSIIAATKPLAPS